MRSGRCRDIDIVTNTCIYVKGTVRVRRYGKAISNALKTMILEDRVCQGRELGIFCCQDDVLGMVNILNSLRWPLM